MWLFSSILVPGELFLIHFQRYVLTGSSISNPKFRFGSGENGKSLALHEPQFLRVQICLEWLGMQKQFVLFFQTNKQLLCIVTFMNYNHVCVRACVYVCVFVCVCVCARTCVL